MGVKGVILFQKAQISLKKIEVQEELKIWFKSFVDIIW